MISYKKSQSVDLKEDKKVLRKNQDLKMPIVKMSSRIEQFKNERPNGEGFTDEGYRQWLRRVCVAKMWLRPRISWTGLYGKEPWPRGKKQWEKI